MNKEEETTTTTTTTSTTTTTTTTPPGPHQSYEPDNTAEYKLQSYWDSRFEKEEEFDWLGTLEDMRPAIQEYLERKARDELRILVLGCGNSTLSHDLFKQGFTRVVSMDYSSVVIEKMRRKHPEMQWVVMDVTDMAAFEDGSFDLVIDKGVMDALVTDEEDQWEPNVAMTRRMCQEVFRVLDKCGGSFIQVSFAQPHFRRLHLIPKTMDDVQSVETMSTPKSIPASENVIGWSFKWIHLPTVGFGYYVFIMERNE